MYKEILEKYLDDLASKRPTPGGGTAAALTAASGVALISMVANFTIGKEKYKIFEAEVKEVLSASETLRQELMDLVDQDVLGYQQVCSAYKLPKDSGENNRKRTEAIQQGLKEALVAPFEVCKCSHQALKLCLVIAEKGNLALISDVAVAAVLLDAAFRSALVNVNVNLKALKDAAFIAEIREVLEPLEAEIDAITTQIQQIVKTKMT